MKVSYKKIRCNKNWNRCIVDSYYQLSAADLIPEDELTQSHVLHIILNGKIRRGEIKQHAVFLPVFDDDSDLCAGCERDSCYGCKNLYPSIRFDME